MTPRPIVLSRPALIMGLLLVFGRHAIGQSTWDQYRPGSITAIVAREQPDVLKAIRHGFLPLTRVSAAAFPTRALVQYEDSVRPTSASHLDVLTAWAKSLRLPIDAATMFKSEVLFREDSVRLWLPTQASLIGAMRSELHRGDHVTLFVGYAGAQARDSTNIDWVFMVNEFSKE